MTKKTRTVEQKKRKNAHQPLKRDDKLLKELIDLLSDWYWEQNSEFIFTCFENCHAAGDASWTGESPLDKRPWETGLLIEGGWEAHRTRLETYKPFYDVVMSQLLPDGKRRYISMSGYPVFRKSGSFAGYRGICKDITGRKQTEEALRTSEEKYRTIIENIEEGYYEIDLAGNFTLVNDSVCLHTGYSREELIGMNNRLYSDEDNAKKVFQAFNKLFKTGDRFKGLEYEIIRKDGAKLFAEISVSLIKDPQGKAIGFRGVSRDVTVRKRHEEELALLRFAIDALRDMIFIVDRTTMKFLYVNDIAFRLTGYTREEYTKMSPQDMLKIDRKTLEHAYDETIAAAPAGITVEMKGTTKDGIRTILELRRSALRYGNRWIIVTIMQDVSRRWLAEESMRLLQRILATSSAINEAIFHAHSSEDMYQRICEAAVEKGKFITAGVFLFDTTGGTEVTVAAASGADKDRLREAHISLSRAISEGSGLLGAAFRTGKPAVSQNYLNDAVSLVKDENTKKLGAVAIVPFIKSDKPIGALIFYAGEKRAFDGEIIRNLEHMAENIIFALEKFEFETRRKLAEEKIQYLATHDALTGLPNRLMFSQLLNHAIQSAKRNKRQFAILFIDLDRFKIINDTLGHEAGDQLLQEIASRLKQILRAADVIARLGGDEFVILMEDMNDPDQVAIVAHRVLSSTIKPMIIMGQECRVTASIGISIYPKDDEDEKSLMKNADIAMYFAKEEGKNNYQFYSKDIKSQSSERLSIETNLRFALDRKELSLMYQAKLNFKTGAITGVEALLRWQNPQLGSVSPLQFIPVAEETGLIVPIGNWVMKTACKQNVEWQRQGLPSISMAVNLSLRQFMDENLFEDIRDALKDSGMAADLLELEITESMVMHNPAHMIATLTKIKDMNMRLAIDDFGTGYSSLAQLKRFPFDTLKIDRSFIRNIPVDAEDKAITNAIIILGKTLNLTIIAEGVETRDQVDFLREHNCDELQGYYFSKPITPDQFADLLRRHIPSPLK